MPGTTTTGLRRLSSRNTFGYKKIFPVMWFGFLLVFTIIILKVTIKGDSDKPPAFVLVLPIFMMAFGYWLMRKLMFDLMDAVYDAGDSLIVVNKGSEERIALANIINVNHSQMVNPRRITLSLRQPCRFGNKVVFCPALAASDFRSFGFHNAIADELVQRVDAARQAAQPTRA